MSHDKHLSDTRKGLNVTFGLFCSVAIIMWVVTVIDWASNRGWGMDPQLLWIAPLMLLGAVMLRLCAGAIFGFIEDNY